MFICFSCSSLQASVAIISPEGEVLFSAEEATSQNANGVCMSLLERGLRETGKRLEDASAFCADVGPGSFIGVRVAVTIAKTLAFVHGAKAAGATSFDLIDPERTVVLPSKKGEYFVRPLEGDVYRTAELPMPAFEGYGPRIEPETFPNAARFASLIGKLKTVAPEELMPEYLIEPSISTPKIKFGAGDK